MYPGRVGGRRRENATREGRDEEREGGRARSVTALRGRDETRDERCGRVEKKQERRLKERKGEKEVEGGEECVVQASRFLESK